MGLMNGDYNFETPGRLRLDPGLPYLYVPQKVYDQFVNVMNTKFGKVCFPDLNICKFMMSCEKLKTAAFGTDMDFQFRVFDSSKNYDFKVKTEKMMVDG